ncbi:hypothetical protein FGG08_000207 [Glutinoglossum americanum]|uniref:Uncharacterized protein n=1 Tax=Glutinoglossum americanum TaxID=1670608 RepID=A0A9P8IDZ2_9PEZI|nr:hypothetical protein FGG08_000207 [Glutinoglossum americanum]
MADSATTGCVLLRAISPNGFAENQLPTTLNFSSQSTNGFAEPANGGSTTSNFSSNVQIVDIRRNGIDHSILDDMLAKLQPAEGEEKRMPTLLLYDSAGLKLFEEITYLDEYYLTNEEIQVLELYAEQIAQRIQPGSILVELGSGNLRKINILLQALDRVGAAFEYYALDLSLPELHRTFSVFPNGTYKNLKCYGLHGTYDDGLEWLKMPENRLKPKCILSLGSSIGNFTRNEAAEFLSGFASSVLRPGNGDLMLVGLDACKNPEKVWTAYNDPKGITEAFIMNGMLHANKVLGKNYFHLDDWNYIGEYNIDAGCHQAFYLPVRDVNIQNIKIKAGEKKARDLHMLSRPPFLYSLRPEKYAARPVPNLSEWENLWAAWTAVSMDMVPQEELFSKPIKLRNACIFYLGHIPTFLDIHLTRATTGKSTEPSYYTQIFERGIDPDVDNPEDCHAHSEIPESWPPVEEILAFQDRVRDRLREQYTAKVVEADRNLGRALWIGFEHEVMHLETLLYMLLQSDKSLPPPDITRPDFEAMAYQAEIRAVPNEWVTVPEQKISIGLEDPERVLNTHGFFGWDNEKPQRSTAVASFQAKARPITNQEYVRYLEETNKQALPASWVCEPSPNGISSINGDKNGHAIGSVSSNQDNLTGKFVRTFFGKVPLAQALHWPVIASYDELAGCAKWMNGRIPTADEVRSIYAYVDQSKTKDAENVLSRTFSAVNGHLSNNGVEETPPSHPPSNDFPSVETSPDPRQLFSNLEGCNVGFKHWHPTPVTQNGNRLSGRCDFGGAWEWTSSTLEKHEGFEPMSLYPAYTG